MYKLVYVNMLGETEIRISPLKEKLEEIIKDNYGPWKIYELLESVTRRNTYYDYGPVANASKHYYRKNNKA